MKTNCAAIVLISMILFVSIGSAIASDTEKEKMKGGMMMCMPTGMMGGMMTLMCTPIEEMEGMHLSDEMKSQMAMKQGELFMQMGEMMMKQGQMMMEKGKTGMMKK